MVVAPDFACEGATGRSPSGRQCADPGSFARVKGTLLRRGLLASSNALPRGKVVSRIFRTFDFG